jgi:hypothetical protein
MSERTEHSYEDDVEPVSTFDLLGGQNIGECSRRQQDGAVLPPAETSMCTDERFECRDVEGDVVHAAVDVEVWRLRHADGSAKHPKSVVAVRLQRVSP